jgi:hypothetical protein
MNNNFVLLNEAKDATMVRRGMYVVIKNHNSREDSESTFDEDIDNMLET